MPSLIHDIATLAVRMTARSQHVGQHVDGRPPDWTHQSGKEGGIVSVSAEGVSRQLQIEQSRWFKAASLRGER